LISHGHMLFPGHSEALSNNFLACKICLEQLRAPKTLPCLHTYCQDCLAQLVHGGHIRCPECHETVPAFNTNFFVNGLLDLVKARACGDLSARKPACALCPLVGGTTTAQCLDCADNLCQACTHPYHVVDVVGYRAAWYDEAWERQVAQCPQDPWQCRLDHPCLPLAKAVRAQRPDLEELLAGVDNNLLELEAEQRVEKEVLTRLQEAAARVGAQVEEAVEGPEAEGAGAAVSPRGEAGRARGPEQVATYGRRVLILGREAEILSLEGAILELHPGLLDKNRQLLRLPFEEQQPQKDGGKDGAGTQGGEESRSQRADAARTERQGGTQPQAKDEAQTPKEKKAQTPREDKTLEDDRAQTPHEDGGPQPQRGGRSNKKRKFKSRLKSVSREPSPALRPNLDGSGRLPRPIFSCSFPTGMHGDKRPPPPITGLCPFDEQNRVLKRFSLNGDCKGTVPIPEGCSLCRVAALQSALAFSAGAWLCLISPDGEVQWRRALSLSQASHVAVYNMEGSLATRFIPGGKANRGLQALVFLTTSPQGHFVGLDWQQHSVVICDGLGHVVGEYKGLGLHGCQPGSVSVDKKGYILLTTGEVNKVVILNPKGSLLGDFLTAYHGLEKPRVTTLEDGGNGSIHVFWVHSLDS
uniref:RING-type E3 ubiquitin transferase n=1 Tax=Cebus imitator TaxID=2715852 RepID=A0A2K5QRC3_CEBIM